MLLHIKAEELKRRRQAIGLTQCKLSTSAGLPTNAIYRLEDGSTKGTSHLRIREIAKVLGCRVEDITESQ